MVKETRLIPNMFIETMELDLNLTFNIETRLKPNIKYRNQT